MTATAKEFKMSFLKAIRDDNAAIFAGAGLSRASGYVDWRNLLRGIADELGLDVDKESDLIAIAQYHFNEKGRHKINQAIIEEFTKEAEQNENLDILARLPIHTYWTTNYDRLIENTIEKMNRKPDVKITQENLAQNVPERDAIVYKMHGDIGIPENAVITKDDFETYNLKRQLFTTKLQGDLISKTFLFIGFSFEDPNLSYILSRIRILLGENKREHYCFFRKLKREDFSNEAEFQYANTKQELRVKDLQRYSINAILVDEYSDITNILKDIENKHKLSNVFISGSAEEYGSFKKEKAVSFMYNLSKSLVKNNYKVISGFGLGVGSYIINGALDEIFASKYKHINEYLILRPFPQFPSSQKTIEELRLEYRNNIINDAGIVIFIFGNKKNSNGEVIDASGVLEEYKIAKEQNKVIIPIGTTGYSSHIITQEVKSDLETFWYLNDSIDVLEKEKDEQNLINEIFKIIDRVKN